MSSGKKGKKSKGKTVPLTDFLAGSGGETPGMVVKSSMNWADDVDDDHDGYMSKPKEPINLPTAPRAARDPGLDEENIPTKPPFSVNLSNLPYETDEAELMEIFQQLNVANIHIPASKDCNKPRGIAYVEFEDRQSLIDALNMQNTYIKNRRVRIELSDSRNEDRRNRMGRDNRRDDRYNDPERTSGDWRSGPREDAPSDSDRYRPRGGFDGRDRRDYREGGADADNKPGGWRDSDRGRPAFRDDRDRDWRPSYGNDRGSRDRNGDRERGSGFGPRRNYGDSDRDWDRKYNKPTASDSEPSEPRTRPKLQLQPRTKPIESVAVKANDEPEPSEEQTVASAPAPAPTPAPAVNIFGQAKPVDTTAREREIEERLTKTYAETRPKEESDSDQGRSDKRGTKEGIWVRRNGESRDDRDRERRSERKPETWRSDFDGGRSVDKPTPRTQVPSTRTESRGDSRGPPLARGPPPASRGPRPSDSRAPPERERKAEKDDEAIKMPKAKDEEAPNFVASNKYSMLPDDVDPDNIGE